MKHPLRNPSSRLSILILLVASLSAVAQPTATNSPVGHWVAEHPSYGGIGSWWNFRPDGTLTMYVGAIATAPVSRSADTLTMPSGQANTPPVTVKYKVEGNTLHLKAPDGHETIFTRIGAAPSATDPLLGQWRPNPTTPQSSDPSEAAYEKALANAVYQFSADGTQSVRIPFKSREGKWQASDHTVHLLDDKVIYTFSRSQTKLTLSQPPDGRKTDTYLPDPLFK
jgi:hypothetical protein